MCIDEDQPSDPRLEATVNKTNVIEMLNTVIDIGKVNEVSNKEVSLMIESMFKEAGLKNKKVMILNNFVSSPKETYLYSSFENMFTSVANFHITAIDVQRI